MNRENTKIGVLLAEIRKAVGLVDELHAGYREFIEIDLIQLGRKRYYFAMDYDWDKLEFLTRTYERLIPAIHGDLADFESFLQALDSDLP